MNCDFCAQPVEILIVEPDGALHTCPDHILARVRRSVVDERWWARMQAPEEEPNTEAVPEVKQAPVSRGGVVL